MAAALVAVWAGGVSFEAMGAVAAGEVVNITGRVVAASLEGEMRALANGNPVNAGDTVVTARNSLVRIKFVDGAYVILRPNTRFQVEDYNFSEQAQENRSVMRLLKGGLRTVTGLISRRNQNGYRMQTSISTIGIRGTDYELVTCTQGDCGEDVPDGDYVGVEDGEIEVETEGGTNPFMEGQYGYIADQTSPPEEIPFEDAGLLFSDPLPEAACE
jgi:hypothetical protein